MRIGKRGGRDHFAWGSHDIGPRIQRGGETRHGCSDFRDGLRFGRQQMLARGRRLMIFLLSLIFNFAIIIIPIALIMWGLGMFASGVGEIITDGVAKAKRESDR
jgi:hypothetical protein